MSLSSPLIVALVPMKHHSVRVPGKNHRLLGGIPLYHHIIKTLGKCSSISEIIIDTDSQEIQADVQTTFPKVRIIERPKDLCGDNAAMIAWAGIERYKKNLLDKLEFPSKARWPLDSSAPFLKVSGLKL